MSSWCSRRPGPGPGLATTALLTTVSALALAGCGGGGSPAGTTPAASSPAPSSSAPSSSAGSSSAGSSASASASPSTGTAGRSTSTPVPEPVRLKPVAVPQRTRTQARAGTGDYLDAVTSVLAEPKQGATSAKGPVRGTALAQLANQSAEYAASGLHVVGRPRVLSSVVVGRRKSPPTLVVAVCLDNSAVKVIDRSGKAQPANPSTKKPTRNILTLVRNGGRWVVSDQSFPNNPDC